MDKVNRNKLLNCTIISLKFLLASPYRLKHLKKSVCLSYAPQKLLFLNNTW